MITEDRPPAELSTVWSELPTPRILVVGDVMLDRYVQGPVDRISQEAPVLVLSARDTESRLGGAANVASLLRALGARVTLAGLVGEDEAAAELRRALKARQIAGLLCSDLSRPTTVKQRFVGHAGHRHPSQVLRVDYESTHELAPGPATSWLERLLPALADHDAVVVSDYAKGACTRMVVQSVIEAARARGLPVLVDPGRGRPLDLYRGCTLLKPNRFEATELLGMSPDNWSQTDLWLSADSSQWPAEHLLITLDAEGMLLCSSHGPPRHLRARPRAVYDITGAGDAVIAALAYAWAGGASPEAAAWLGNLAGGLEVEKPGVAPVTRAEIAAELERYVTTGSPKILGLTAVAEACRRHHQRGERVVLTNGCFDLLHYGHVQYLQEARQLGDRLVVAVNSDASVRRLKGPTRPVIVESQRAAMLAALACVDYVVLFDEDTPHRVLEQVRPDVLVKGGTYRIDEVVGREIVEAYGGRVEVLGVVEGLSTTRIVEKIRGGLASRRRAG